jgi:hypothetical protein
MLKPRNGNTRPTPNGWRFQISAGQAGQYRFAQLDDYSTLARRRFPWQAGTVLRLRCRISQPALPGTWGFGLWNDPFSAALGLGGMGTRLPVLPNSAWFFYASPENHLSFQRAGPVSSPASGFVAQTFSAPRIPGLALAPGFLAAPLLFFKPTSRWLRDIFAANVIREEARLLELDVTQWHGYQLEWGESRVKFLVDGELQFESAISPQGPLGLVIWIDNQFASWKPDGDLGMGLLPNPPAWMEIEQLEID